MKNTFITNLVYSAKAGTSIVPFRFMGITDPAVYCGANARAMGVSMDSAEAGEGIPIALNGIVQVEAGGSITAGDAVASDANGKAVSASDFAAEAPTVAAPTVALAAGDVPVTSDAATPTITVTAGTVTAGDLSGGVLPQAVNGYALESASSGDLVRVRLV